MPRTFALVHFDSEQRGMRRRETPKKQPHSEVDLEAYRVRVNVLLTYMLGLRANNLILISKHDTVFGT